MYFRHTPSSLPSASELLVTVVTLEPFNLVQLPVLVEVFFSVEAPPAVPDTAEEGTSEVHLPMNPHGLVMDCLGPQTAQESLSVLPQLSRVLCKEKYVSS